jgi:hypothetical protein
MANPTYSNQGWIARLASSASRLLDGQPSDSRGPRVLTYGENASGQVVGQGRELLCDEGSYFVIGNATPGTGIATIAALTAVVDTSPFLILQNNDTLGRGLIPDYLRLTLTVAGTNAASLHMTTKMDTVAARYSSGATLIVGATGAAGGQIVVPRSGLSTVPPVACWAGPIVAAAASSGSKIVMPDLFWRTVIPVVGDTYTLRFGAVDVPGTGAPLNGTVPSHFSQAHPPVVIDNGHALLVHLWLPSQTVASNFEIELGAYLR